MSGPLHPTGRGFVSSTSPRALGVCDRCGMTYNLRDLRWQNQWQGNRLVNLRLLVCTRTCLDVPQIQLRTLILPPDPVPVLNPRPEMYSAEVPSNRIQDNLVVRLTDDGITRILEINTTPGFN